MLYRGRINGKWFLTSNLNELVSCNSIDIFILGFWEVYE